MNDIKKYIRESRSQEVSALLESLIEDLQAEGYTVEFGRIGERTNYALLYTEGHKKEIVGYTFIQNMEYYRENVGKLKALQQAIARKEMAKNPRR